MRSALLVVQDGSGLAKVIVRRGILPSSDLPFHMIMLTARVDAFVTAARTIRDRSRGKIGKSTYAEIVLRCIVSARCAAPTIIGNRPGVDLAARIKAGIPSAYWPTPAITRLQAQAAIRERALRWSPVETAAIPWSLNISFRSFWASMSSSKIKTFIARSVL